MDRVKRTQIQVKTILRDYRNMFSNIKDDRELVETFKSLFTSSRNYWKHVLKHAVPKSVKQKFKLETWRDVQKESHKLFPYQINYARQFVDTLSYLEKVAVQKLPGHTMDRILFISSKNRIAVILEPTGHVASLFEFDIFKNWEAWKNELIEKGSVILEVPLDEEIRRASLGIRKDCKKLL